jgi:hypothetical protein
MEDLKNIFIRRLNLECFQKIITQFNNWYKMAPFNLKQYFIMVENKIGLISKDLKIYQKWMKKFKQKYWINVGICFLYTLNNYNKYYNCNLCDW